MKESKELEKCHFHMYYEEKFVAGCIELSPMTYICPECVNKLNLKVNFLTLEECFSLINILRAIRDANGSRYGARNYLDYYLDVLELLDRKLEENK